MVNFTLYMCVQKNFHIMNIDVLADVGAPPLNKKLQYITHSSVMPLAFVMILHKSTHYEFLIKPVGKIIFSYTLRLEYENSPKS